MAKKRKISAEKSPFTLRRRRLSDGRTSLFIDRRTAEGHDYEFLGLYLLPEGTTKAKRANAKTLRMAEDILQERAETWLLEQAAAGIPKSGKNILLSDWMLTVYERHEKRDARDLSDITSTRRFLVLFDSGIHLSEIDKPFILSFIDWMRNTYRFAQDRQLSPKTMKNRCITLNMALNEAKRDGLIAQNPFRLIDPSEKVKATQAKREYLTIDEVKRMAEASCPDLASKRAFLFACFTGLRLSDVMKLTWSNICFDGEPPYLSVMMTKTDKPVIIPLSKQAMRWIPEQTGTNEDARVFEDLLTGDCVRANVKTLAKNAGISKDICFHTARHTFATMLLTVGADIYTVSKLLGHATVRHTQIYAKIVDKSKDAAVGLLDTAF